MLPDLLAYAGRKHEPVRFVTYREIAQAAGGELADVCAVPAQRGGAAA